MQNPLQDFTETPVQPGAGIGESTFIAVIFIDDTGQIYPTGSGGKDYFAIERLFDEGQHVADGLEQLRAFKFCAEGGERIVLILLVRIQCDDLKGSSRRPWLRKRQPVFSIGIGFLESVPDQRPTGQDKPSRFNAIQRVESPELRMVRAALASRTVVRWGFKVRRQYGVGQRHHGQYRTAERIAPPNPSPQRSAFRCRNQSTPVIHSRLRSAGTQPACR